LLQHQEFRSTKIKHCHDNFCRYAGLDGQSNTQPFTQRARAILNIQLTVLTSRIAINFEHRQWSHVHVREKNGCGTVTDEVYLLMYPKFFTPNDGFNDTWKIKFSDNEIG
jgi:hypothetical protein